VTSVTRTPTTGSPRTWSFTYAPTGLLATSTSPAGVILTYTWDEAHDLRQIEDSAGNRVEYLYDLAGNRTSEQLKDSSGTLHHEIELAYDTRNRVSQLTEGASVTDLVLDAVGNLTSETDPNNHTTTLTPDPLDRVITELSALPGTTQLQYAVNDQVSQVTAPNGVVTGYVTDDLGLLVTETSPDRGTLGTNRDAAGNLTSVNYASHSESFTWDALNRPLTRNYPGTAQDESFTYDSCTNGAGRLCSIVHEAGTTSFEFDAFGNPTHKTEVLSGRTYHTYYAWDGDDRLAQITYPTGHIVAYARDAQGRIQAVTLDGANVVTNRSYRGDGKLLSQTYGNGLAEARTYNALGLLGTYALGAVENETFSWDDAGNMLSRSGSSWSLGFGYDAIDRLTTDNGGSGNRSYAYDTNGNRLTKTVNGTPTSSTYQSATNRLATVGGSSVSINAEGRTTAVSGYTYLYNNAGRLSTVKQGSATKGTYAYDASGLRRRKVASGVTTIYHFDEAGHLLAETNTSGVMQRLYVWADESPVAQKVSTTLTYLHTDHLDTPRWGTSTAGVLVWRWRSDGFGEALPEQDPDGNGTQVSVNLRFPGQYYDAESGLHQNWMRDYTPGYGRYAQADPIGQRGGVDLYGYARDNPVNLADPLGLAPYTNNSNVPIPYKGEHQSYEPPATALPGETVDADGIYSPPGTANSMCLKIPSNCSASTDERGRTSVECDLRRLDPWGRGRPRVLGPEDLSEQQRPDWPDPYTGRNWPYPIWPKP
jgi:RHS repeat-associated protein